MLFGPAAIDGQALPGLYREERPEEICRLLGIPVGYALARLLNWLLLEVVKIEFAFTFPPLNVLIALVGTVVLALLIMRIPLRRAVRYRPGEALRYA